MDPDANLAEQEQILTRRRQYAQAGGPPSADERQDAARLRELRAALRAWLDAGGFAPDWTKAPLATKYYEQFLTRRHP